MKTFLKIAHLKGYRTINDVKAQFNSGLNIIIGQNGSGKTNFLTFLYSSIKNPFKPFSNQSSELTYEGEKSFSVKAVNAIMDSAELLHESKLKYSANFEVQLENGEYSFLKAEDYNEFLLSNKLSVFAQFIPHGIRKDNKFIDTPFSILYKAGDGVELIQEYLEDSNSWFVRSFCLNLFIDGYSSAGDDFNLARAKKKIVDAADFILKKAINDINENIKNFLPIEEIRISPTFRIFNDEEDDTVKFEGLALEYFFNGSWLPFSSLSDGTKRLFCLYAEIIADFKTVTKLKGYSLGCRIILLEEPELGIHPHQFHKIMLFLKEVSKDYQIIMTTHSPQALNIFGKDDLDSINICTFETKSGSAINRLTEAEQSKARAFMDEMYLSDYWVNSTLNRT